MHGQTPWGLALAIFMSSISSAESVTSLPGAREESEISLPDIDGLPPGLQIDSDDEYLDTYIYDDVKDYGVSDDESEIDLPGKPTKVTQCCAKLCTNNSESAEHKVFLSSLLGAGASSDHEQRVYNLILEKTEKRVKLGKY